MSTSQDYFYSHVFAHNISGYQELVSITNVLSHEKDNMDGNQRSSKKSGQ